jgi:hypothetical protein
VAQAAVVVVTMQAQEMLAELAELLSLDFPVLHLILLELRLVAGLEF